MARIDRVRPLRRAALAVLAGVSLLAGCGQRGPLYLPDQAPPKKSLSPPTVSAPALASTPLPSSFRS